MWEILNRINFFHNSVILIKLHEICSGCVFVCLALMHTFVPVVEMAVVSVTCWL